MKRLTGSAGTGSKIMNNLSIFSFELDKEVSTSNFFAFKVSFGNQKGFFNYRKEDEIIKDVNLDVTGFPKTLGSHNDSSLYDVAKMIDSTL